MSTKVALIVGASRGLGLGLVQHLASKGYQVYATERSQSDTLHAAADASKGAIAILSADVTDDASISDLRDAIPEASLDLMVMNAGIYGGSEQELADITRGNLGEIMMTNAVGPVQAAVALMPCMKDGATIGMMSSKMGSIADSSGGVNLYRISKVGQNMLARSLFEEHAKGRGIAVLSLHPGWVKTDMGGPNALINVDTSVSGMIALLEEDRAPEHRFLAYDGSEIGW